MGNEEGQDYHPLRIHHPRHNHQHELRTKTPTLSASQPYLILHLSELNRINQVLFFFFLLDDS
ncbi:hypothetical protein Ahy_A03g013332 isoform B [Arachis hypogaea]|uniref:Uncharacterized protein n=1 Tax=Arachis hypogaea TaxID=3818 RepID=A0A445DV52_ARAHY|nr:hypothetical protein Ahy_A03g013332 isoform B [Arachis hypogaea]